MDPWVPSSSSSASGQRVRRRTEKRKEAKKGTSWVRGGIPLGWDGGVLSKRFRMDAMDCLVDVSHADPPRVPRGTLRRSLDQTHPFAPFPPRGPRMEPSLLGAGSDPLRSPRGEVHLSKEVHLWVRGVGEFGAKPTPTHCRESNHDACELARAEEGEVGAPPEHVDEPRMSLRTLSKGDALHEGRYVIRRELNRGGTAIVYEADDLERGIQVALKVMNAKNGVMTVPAKTVHREINLASSVQHDNIVQLLAVFSDGEQVVLVWELVSGPDLLDLLNECGGRMSEHRASNYFAQLLEGVMFLHDNGLCHRDLKPENCMIDSKTDKLKIIDFGLSKHVESAITLGVGTPDYMPPEMLSGTTHMVAMVPADGKRMYDPKAVDVWAMGVMLYLCVVGAYPFEDPNHPNNVARTLQNVRDGKIRPIPSDLSSHCRDLIKSMLCRKPEKRITLQGMMHHPWLKKKISQKLQSKMSGQATLGSISPTSSDGLEIPKTPTPKSGFNFSSFRIWGKKAEKAPSAKLYKKRSGA